MNAIGSYQTPGDHYRAQAVGTAGPAQLILMLYDGAIAAIAKADQSLATASPGTYETVNRELTRAQDILVELRLSLDHDHGGSIASSLSALYDFCLDRLVEANLSKDREPLPSVLRTLSDLREAWQVAAASLVPAS